MKAKVIKEYIDKHTQKFHGIGEEITLTAERFAEIEKAGSYVVMIEQGKPVEQPGVETEAPVDDQEKGQPEETAVAEQSETVEPDEPVEDAKTEKTKKTRRNRK